MEIDDSEEMVVVEGEENILSHGRDVYGRESTYEEICRAHVESCFEASVGYQVSSSHSLLTSLTVFSRLYITVAPALHLLGRTLMSNMLLFARTLPNAFS